MNPSDVIDGRYRLERLLGTGGVAEVWLAEDQRLERWVAVKVLREGFGTEYDSDLVRSFEREARVIARLQHPNIVGVYDAGRFGARHYLVMEYVHGHTLRQILEAHGRLAELDAIRYGAHVAGALQYAHDRGVIHCDVKPENIIVTEQGVPKVTDFGVAETISRTLSPDQARDIVGTIAYLAPEVLQGSPATPRSDVYSLSMTIYEAIAGRLPFSGANPAAVAGQRLAAPAPALRTFARDASPEVEAVLGRGLSVSPLDRYASAAEFAAALQRAGFGAAGWRCCSSAAGGRYGGEGGGITGGFPATYGADRPAPATTAEANGRRRIDCCHRRGAYGAGAGRSRGMVAFPQR